MCMITDHPRPYWLSMTNWMVPHNTWHTVFLIPPHSRSETACSWLLIYLARFITTGLKSIGKTWLQEHWLTATRSHHASTTTDDWTRVVCKTSTVSNLTESWHLRSYLELKWWLFDDVKNVLSFCTNSLLRPFFLFRHFSTDSLFGTEFQLFFCYCLPRQFRAEHFAP